MPSTKPIVANFLVLAAFLIASTNQAAPPQWWTSRGVLNGSLPAADYAVINLGQLKNFVTKAADEMNALMPGGAGTALNQQVAAWATPGANATDFAAANLGQVKTLAAMVYDRPGETKRPSATCAALQGSIVW